MTGRMTPDDLDRWQALADSTQVRSQRLLEQDIRAALDGGAS